MNLDFLKDLVSLKPIKTSYISNNIRNIFNFIINDHIKEKEIDEDNITLLEKLNKIFTLFLLDKLDQTTLFELFGNKLDLNKNQFNYLYERIKKDIYINTLIKKINKLITHYKHLPQLTLMLDNEDGFLNLSTFLIRECNLASQMR